MRCQSNTQTEFGIWQLGVQLLKNWNLTFIEVHLCVNKTSNYQINTWWKLDKGETCVILHWPKSMSEPKWTFQKRNLQSTLGVFIFHSSFIEKERERGKDQKTARKVVVVLLVFTLLTSWLTVNKIAEERRDFFLVAGSSLWKCHYRIKKVTWIN